MQFNYQSYLKLLSLLKENAYSFADYHNWSEKQRCVILRHDIDNSPEKALEMAMLEYSEGVQSTYFVLLTNNTQHDTTKKRSHKSGSSCYFRGMRGYISISKSSGFRRLPGTAIFL